MNLKSLGLFLLATMFAVPLFGQSEKFSKLVGDVKIKEAEYNGVLKAGYITWGGEIPAFYANGNSLTTKNGIYKDLGLNVEFSNGDDFVSQVKRYMQGEQHLLRGTMRMLGQASEVLGQDPRTKPRVILQLTYSLGDHIVARAGIRTLNDLKGKKVVAQQGGPHVGVIYDGLEAAGLSKDDVTIVWVSDLSGPNGPAERFRKDKTIDACCVITPDMLGLCSGLEETGSGAEGTIQGSHVVVSTFHMSRSVADVWACSESFYEKNKVVVDKFVAGYLKACEEFIPLRGKYDATGTMDPKYKSTLVFAQKQFNKDAGDNIFPTIEEDVHGLLLDANFVGLTGNISFFEDRGNSSGFEAKQKAALDLATTWGYATSRSGFNPSGLDYKKIAGIGGIEYKAPNISRSRIKGEGITEFPDSMELDERTIVSFTISFEPNQNEFSFDTYGAEFDRAIKQASIFGNSALVIRGHSDPTKTLADMVRAGVKKGTIKRTGARGSYKYTIGGRALHLDQTKKIVTLIEAGQFDGTSPNPRQTMQAALNLSKTRADAVAKALVDYAKKKNINLDLSQLKPVGAGISEPVIPKPTKIEEARENMRVEFRIIKVAAEALEASDFDF
ncbi:MAG: ABC transporter substrate-binding protein [Candidatus Thorarchaeota archaeon]|jgi:ABC-type nitrate/sulfonate/bicarbonate transport system substrate-binding protein